MSCKPLCCGRLAGVYSLGVCLPAVLVSLGGQRGCEFRQTPLLLGEVWSGWPCWPATNSASRYKPGEDLGLDVHTDDSDGIRSASGLL